MSIEERTGPCLCGGPKQVKQDKNGDSYIEVCPLYTKVRGQSPNTGEMLDEYRCAIAWLPLLMIENAQQTRQAGAAIESLRNENTKRQDAALKLGILHRAENAARRIEERDHGEVEEIQEGEFTDAGKGI